MRTRRGLAALLLLLGVALVFPQAAHASTVCGTRTKHYSVQSGPSWTPYVAWIELHIQTCSNGSVITGTAGSGDSDETGPGTTAGFVISHGTPVLESADYGGFAGGYAKYYMGATLKDCLPGGVTVWCSFAADFSLRGQITMESAINWDYACAGYCSLSSTQFVLAHRIFNVSFWWVCRNSACTDGGVRLNGTTKSTYV